jgi:hypothetical protein
MSTAPQPAVLEMKPASKNRLQRRIDSIMARACNAERLVEFQQGEIAELEKGLNDALDLVEHYKAILRSRNVRS